jgi:hypothetical protein
MTREIPIGLGAGLAAALLMLAALSGSTLGLALAMLAALPITVATLSWGYRGGLIAAVVAVAVLCGVLGVQAGLAFGVSVALPAWGLAYLAIVGFGAGEDGQGRISIGTLVIIAGVLSALSAIFTTVSLGNSYGDSVRNLEQQLTEFFRAVFAVPKDQPLVLPDVTDAAATVHVLSRVILPMSAFVGTIASLCGLWLSGRIARISGRLPRPWPDIAALRLPIWSAVLLGAGCLISMLPDIYGLAGQLLLAAMLAAFAMQGFAVVHFITRSMAARPLLLAAVYLVCFIMSWIALSVIAMIGILDLFFNLRGRSGSNGRPPSPAKQN